MSQQLRFLEADRLQIRGLPASKTFELPSSRSPGCRCSKSGRGCQLKRFQDASSKFGGIAVSAPALPASSSDVDVSGANSTAATLNGSVESDLRLQIRTDPFEIRTGAKA